MQLAACIEPLFSPIAPFLRVDDFEWLEDCLSLYKESRYANTSELTWVTSSLNPCNRMQSFRSQPHRKWRIDGCTAMGRQYHALPIFMFPNLSPKGIVIIIPCQSKHPRHIRAALDSSRAFGMQTAKVRDLGIAEYVLQALDAWSARQPYFEEIYRALPFGSKIIFENIASNPSDSVIRFVPDNSWSEHALSISSLQSLWSLPVDKWPASIRMESLQVVAQMNNNVTLVRAPQMGLDDLFVFKTNLRGMKLLYHELRLLLNMEKHPNVVPEPLRIVTYNSSSEKCNSQELVAGFLLPYYPNGNLGAMLESREELPVCLRLKWALQITEALQHIRRGPARFFSDLKPDNIMLSKTNRDVVIIDFEQAGNWDSFSPPEVVYLQWLQKLLTQKEIPEHRRKEYATLSEDIITWQSLKDDTQTSRSDFFLHAWTRLSTYEQEKAMVFSVGKILWCIFEGCSHTRNAIDEKFEQAVDVKFPQFRKTPLGLQKLILSCTYGASEYGPPESFNLVREDSAITIETTNSNGSNSPSSPLEVLEAANLLWKERLTRMETYVKAMARWVRKSHSNEDSHLLGFPLRCSLSDVIHHLQEELQKAAS